MSQDFTDDCFDPDHDALATDMPNIEKNFAALKSCFSGATAPPDTVAGMGWLDTTTHILKMRNEANDGWISIFNMASGTPAGFTATAAEINAACDGITATAAEINTACDGTTARNSHVHSNLTITAGSNMTGGGALSAGVTLNALMAGQVACDDPVATRTTTSTTYVTACTLYADVDDISVLRVMGRLKSSVSTQTASLTFTIGGLTATAVGTTSTSYTTVRSSSLNVSSLSGLQTITVQIKITNVLASASLQQASVYIG